VSTRLGGPLPNPSQALASAPPPPTRSSESCMSGRVPLTRRRGWVRTRMRSSAVSRFGRVRFSRRVSESKNISIAGSMRIPTDRPATTPAASTVRRPRVADPFRLTTQSTWNASPGSGGRSAAVRRRPPIRPLVAGGNQALPHRDQRRLIAHQRRAPAPTSSTATPLVDNANPAPGINTPNENVVTQAAVVGDCQASAGTRRSRITQHKTACLSCCAVSGLR
jgi:hypothetical protein